MDEIRGGVGVPPIGAVDACGNDGGAAYADALGRQDALGESPVEVFDDVVD